MVKKTKVLKSTAKEKQAPDVAAVRRAQVANNIRLFRKNANLTQDQLAKKGKLSGRYLAELEREGGQNITLDTLTHLANALNIEVADLINGVQPMVKRKTSAVRATIEMLEHYCSFLESMEGGQPDVETETPPDPEDVAHDEAVARRKGGRKPK